MGHRTCGIPPLAATTRQVTPIYPKPSGRLHHYALVAAALAKARTVSAEHVQRACDEVRP